MPPPEKYTSASFSGEIAMMQASTSWVAKWQGIDKCCDGLYAIRVHGRISRELEEELEEAGYKYRPRDGSVRD